MKNLLLKIAATLTLLLSLSVPCAIRKPTGRKMRCVSVPFEKTMSA